MSTPLERVKENSKKNDAVSFRSSRVYFSNMKKTGTQKLECHVETLHLPSLTGWSITMLPCLLDAPVLWQGWHTLLYCGATICFKLLFNFVFCGTQS
jgi:hypothetical protein